MDASEGHEHDQGGEPADRAAHGRPGTRRPDELADGPAPPGAAALAARLSERVDAQRRRELARALRRLDATGDPTPRERAVVAALSRSLAAAVLAPPLSALDRGDVAAADLAALFALDD